MSATVALPVDDVLAAQPRLKDEAGFGALSSARGALPLEAMTVQARLEGLGVELEVRQTFVNPFPEPIEADYIFPLPDRLAVTRFRMETAHRTIEGVLKERARAQQDFHEALLRGQQTALAEEDRPGVFTMRVGNIPPGERATVSLNLAGTVEYADGEATFRFPLVVAPRYIPGNPLPTPPRGVGLAPDTDAVPDASCLTPPVLLPGFPNPVRLSLSVEILPSPLALQEPRSSLHTIFEAVNEEGVRRLVLAPCERLDRDFVLRFRIAEAALSTSLVLHPDATGDGGTYAVTLVPPGTRVTPSKPRDIVFVLDRSGSMGGSWKMVSASRAVARLLETLTPRDRFTILAFSDRIQYPDGFPSGQLVSAEDLRRTRATAFLEQIIADGGTELAQPLELAVHLLSGSSERERVLVLVTDGQVGNEDQILRNVGSAARNLRLFALGIDSAVNEGFLRRLAALGTGSHALVESRERFEEVIDQLHRRIDTPVLTDLCLEADGLNLVAGTQVPRRLPDLFQGAPLTVAGRYRGTPRGGLRLSARTAEGTPWSQRLEGRRGRSPAVTYSWVRGQLRELEDEAMIHGNRKDLERQILETSLKFGVLCRYTAFVAVNPRAAVEPGVAPPRVVQPVETPATWAASAPMDMMLRFDAMPRASRDVSLRSRTVCAMSFPSPPPSKPGATSKLLDDLSLSDEDCHFEVSLEQEPQKHPGSRGRWVLLLLGILLILLLGIPLWLWWG